MFQVSSILEPSGPPASPTPRRVRTPSWFDLRLIFGVALVLISIVVGAVVLSRADSTRPVLAVTRDLAVGTTLTDADVRVVRLRLTGSDAVYVAKSSDAVGKVLTRALGDGDLLPASALGQASADLSMVAIKFDPSTVPTIERGQRISVFVSTQYCPAGLALIKNVTVQSVSKQGGGIASSSQQIAVVAVPAASASEVLSVVNLTQVTVSIAVLTGPDTRTSTSSVDVADPSACLPPTK